MGDTVYVLVPRVLPGNAKKFSKRYTGPYTVTKVRGLNAYVKPIGTSGIPTGVEFVVHLQRLKKAKPPQLPAAVPTYKQRAQKTAQVTACPNQPTHSYGLRPR